MKEDVELWLDEANWDLENAKILLKNRRYNTAVFHSQQASEKAVKSLLISCNLNGWGHSISALLKKYNELINRSINSIEKEALYLDKQYIPTRYPDALPGIAPHKAYNKEEAESAVKQAEKIINYVKKEIEYFKEKKEEENAEFKE